ncbi:DNA cytosine methyltransferase [Algibacter sp. PT7-4]|uniref:DNA cytosine methyltransferase n=1 Tax=Algibacter ulvanivorans TaxID=3400999 RepID=UPI003AAD7E50
MKNNTLYQFKIQNFINHVFNNYNPDKPLVIWLDLFCGAGGTSTGIQFAKENTFVAACVNHDTNAIKSHEKNHPKAVHLIEDIKNFKVVKNLEYLVKKIRLIFPKCIINLWASLECTNFSKAKGGQAKNADSRTLAEHMFMYLEKLDVNYFWVENVREFMSWGPLNENGKPISRKEGKDYIKWLKKIKRYGFKYDAKILNAANFGAYQSRERLFIQFAKKPFSISWPEQTHTKDKADNVLFPMKKWKSVKDILNLEDEGMSIFHRKKELSNNTLKRIYAGLEKFVANGESVFTKRYNGGKVNPHQKVNSIDKPIGTILSNNTHALVKSVFIKKYYSGRPKGKVISVTGSAGSITTSGGQAIVTASHLSTYNGNFGLHSIEHPSPTITTKDRVCKVDVNFIDEQYGNGTARSIEKPIGALTTIPKFSLVKAKHYIFNPGWGGNHSSIEKPCCTVIARQDKAPLYLVSTELGYITLPVYKTDSEIMIKIKKFMVAHGVIDIKMRMLNIQELKQIQGFPVNYKLVGNKTQQKKYIGNAVEVNQAKALINANYEAIEKSLNTAA